MRALAVPNDPQIPKQAWYLGPGATGVNAYGAWDVTVGSTSTIVAVIDSGYRPHADLADRILPGYDFIEDIDVANDGNGRDPDASDPGDWTTQADLRGAFAGMDCSVMNSTWNGTGVASIIAADTDNGAGIAGLNWRARILPLRVLGKCGGTTSDIVDAIAWAGGFAVPGVPANPFPAQIINLSFGGPGACDPAEQSTINAVLAKGITRAVVVAAGNFAGNVAFSDPANCVGVIAVGATASSTSTSSGWKAAVAGRWSAPSRA
jgi:serine protease